MIVGCINDNKKNVDAETQRKVISDYALANDLIIDVFYNYDNVSQVTESFQTNGHIVLFANIVSIGENLAQVKDNLRLLLAKSLKIISIKENMILESGKDAEMLLQGLEQAAEIMSSMISVSSKRALADKKEQGYKLGRKTGYRNQKYIWSGKEDEIKQKANELGIADSVIFLGVRKDTNRVYQAYDMFLFPSLWEGLPLTGIEAQTAGLPVLMSDVITPETIVTDNVTTFSLSNTAEQWADKALDILSSYKRADCQSQVIKAGFDIQETADWLQSFYIERTLKARRAKK